MAHTATGRAWTLLLAGAVLEAVWATALDHRAWWVFGVALVLSLLGLERATRQIPIGTGYAVWTGLGAALTVGVAFATGAEAVSWPKVLFITGIVVAVAGLKLHRPATAPPVSTPRSR